MPQAHRDHGGEQTRQHEDATEHMMHRFRPSGADPVRGGRRVRGIGAILGDDR